MLTRFNKEASKVKEVTIVSIGQNATGKCVVLTTDDGEEMLMAKAMKNRIEDIIRQALTIPSLTKKLKDADNEMSNEEIIAMMLPATLEVLIFDNATIDMDSGITQSFPNYIFDKKQIEMRKAWEKAQQAQ